LCLAVICIISLAACGGQNEEVADYPVEQTQNKEHMEKVDINTISADFPCAYLRIWGVQGYYDQGQKYSAGIYYGGTFPLVEELGPVMKVVDEDWSSGRRDFYFLYLPTESVTTNWKESIQYRSSTREGTTPTRIDWGPPCQDLGEPRKIVMDLRALMEQYGETSEDGTTTLPALVIDDSGIRLAEDAPQ
jgi:hypothetical protein